MVRAAISDNILRVEVNLTPSIMCVAMEAVYDESHILFCGLGPKNAVHQGQMEGAPQVECELCVGPICIEYPTSGCKRVLGAK